ncbi:conjugal transfer protein TraG N-terminal domain-containing protein [Vibrio parahaemolyticus]|nr:conjugal transfer protein TraG N-terminal domain-containing protein [Vibrio parahaemolyticus]MDN4724022.1 conjugal transfer protein TraG N-terminal domain-containing protein [Vibrio parahaemolyticus]
MMPEFTIYSIGDSALLEQVLIAVAMITGTNDFTKMASIGLLVSVVIVCVKGVVQGGRGIEIQQVLIGWIVYAIFSGHQLWSKSRMPTLVMSVLLPTYPWDQRRLGE